MKISQLHIPRYKQFKNFTLNLTYPDGHEKAGRPLDRVCFIGRNGTGKTTLLRCLYGVEESFIPFRAEGEGYIYLYGWLVRTSEGIERVKTLIPAIDELADWQPITDKNTFVLNRAIDKEIVEKVHSFLRSNDIDASPWRMGHQRNLKAFIQCDLQGEGSEHPIATLQQASKLQGYPNHARIAPHTVGDFWNMVLGLHLRRKTEFEVFARQNGDKTYNELQAEFNKIKPDFLLKLTELWNRILEPTQIYVAIDETVYPTLINEPFETFLRHKQSNAIVEYHQLSSGIRDFMFKIGYLYGMYFNLDKNNSMQNAAVVAIDEPENGLFPDFLYGYIDKNLFFIKDTNTQLFVATHSPIIAAEFEPYERVILDLDENGYVTASIGTSPIGDDANDILTQDFGANPYNRHPLAKASWDRYIELLKQLSDATLDKSTKIKIWEEYKQIQRKYNFPVELNKLS